jgi:hypothetical protein
MSPSFLELRDIVNFLKKEKDSTISGEREAAVVERYVVTMEE